jgi:hypothetical protein
MATAKTCEGSSQCGKGSPINIGTAAYQDKIVSFWKNPTSFVEKNLEGNPSRVFLCRFVVFQAMFVIFFLKVPEISPKNFKGIYLLDKNSNFKVRRWHVVQLMSYFYKFRFALRPCLIISSNKLVRQFLNEKSDHTYNGLRDFVYSLFGQNILFSDPEEAKVYREIILRLMKPMQCYPGSTFQDSLNLLTQRWMSNELSTQDPIVLYKAFKRFSTNLVTI